MLVIAVLLLCKAQAQINYIDSKKMLAEGIALYDKGEYKKSIERYKQIDESDTNYASAVYEQVVSLQADSSFEAAKLLALSGLNLPKSDKRLFFLALAANYDYLQHPDSALVIYDSVIKLYPNDHQPWFEEGVLYFRKKLYDKAITYFQHSLLMNPNHFKSHYLLGLTYAMQGRLSEALIALQASLLMTSNTTFAKQSISLISGITDETDEVVKLYHAKATKYSDPLFDELDEIVNAKLALNKNYKLKVSISDNIFRQLQVVMEKLEYNSEDTNFVMQFYVPLLAEVYEKDMFESYVLLLFSDFGFENVDGLAKTKSKDVADVKALVFPYFAKIQTTREISYKKRKNAVERYHYYPDDNVIIIGEMINKGDAKIIVGDAVFLRGNHTLKSRGHYNNGGEKDGWWTYYYSSGGIEAKEFYMNDTSVDSAYYYYINGNPEKVIIRNKHGNSIAEYEYEYGGWLSTVRKIISEKKYEEHSYYSNGQKEIDAIYEGSNLQNGTYLLYHSNGKLKKRYSIEDGKYSGKLTFYYDDGNLSEISTYSKGVLNGPYEDHYESGAIKKKYTNDSGKANGPYEEYYESGNISEKGIYNKGNKDDITKYSKAGKIYGTLSLKNNVPIHIKYVNEGGGIIFEREDKNGIYTYPLFCPNGDKAVDMKINDKGVRNGLLTFYFTTGGKSEETNYKDGNLDGTSVTFFSNGNKKFEGSYINDQKDGYFKTYYFNGLLSEEGWYKNGEKQGLWRTYNVNGKVSNEKYFLNDNIDGYYKIYNINGELTDKYIYDKGLPAAHICYDTTGAKADSIFFNHGYGSYKFSHGYPNADFKDLSYCIDHGKFSGPTIKRYVNGAVQEQYYFTEGNYDSLNILYFPDGIIQRKGYNRKGNKIGKWEYFNEVGELYCGEYYNWQGRLDGARKIYSCNSLRIEYSYNNGSKDGKQIYYGENGKIAFILIYGDGDLVGYTYEGKDGKLLPEIKVKNGTVKMEAYYGNGQKSGEANFDQNVIIGALRVYYSNGQLAEERNYKNFDLDGPLKRYNPDGKLIFDATYKDDQEEGLERYFDKNGNLIIAANFYCGSRHGSTAIIDPTVGKTRTYNYRYGKLISAKK